MVDMEKFKHFDSLIKSIKISKEEDQANTLEVNEYGNHTVQLAWAREVVNIFTYKTRSSLYCYYVEKIQKLFDYFKESNYFEGVFPFKPLENALINPRFHSRTFPRNWPGKTPSIGEVAFSGIYLANKTCLMLLDLKRREYLYSGEDKKILYKFLIGQKGLGSDKIKELDFWGGNFNVYELEKEFPGLIP